MSKPKGSHNSAFRPHSRKTIVLKSTNLQYFGRESAWLSAISILLCSESDYVLRFYKQLASNAISRQFSLYSEEGKMELMRERLFKRLIDVFVLVELKKKSMSGYDVISMLHTKYDLLVSPGTVYALLYSMEREGLIEGRWDERKRVYELTSLGLQDTSLLKAAGEEVQLLLANMQEATV